MSVCPNQRHSYTYPAHGCPCTVKPVTNDHPFGPEKAVRSLVAGGPLVRGLHRTTIIMNVRPSVPGKVVCSTRLVASHDGLYSLATGFIVSVLYVVTMSSRAICAPRPA